MRVIISAGGTGGHIYPALAILNKIKQKEKNSEFLYIGTHNRMEKDLIPEMGINYKALTIVGFNRKKIFKNVETIKLFLQSINEAKKIIKEFKPDVVIGCGGYVTAPVIYAASKLRIPTFIHEQNSVVGVSNKFLSRYATLIGVSFKSTLECFPKKKVIYTGNPCSEKAIKGRSASKSEYGLSEKKKLVLIVMGSLGSRTVNDKIVKMLAMFDKGDYETVFVTGKAYYEKVANLKYKNVLIYPFINDLSALMKKTDLIVTRAGASTISEIIALNIPSIFIPSPYVPNNHQYKNAMDLVNNQAGIILEEKDLDERLVGMVNDLLNDQEKRQMIKNNLKKMMIEGSATIIYESIKQVLEKWKN